MSQTSRRHALRHETERRQVALELAQFITDDDLAVTEDDDGRELVVCPECGERGQREGCGSCRLGLVALPSLTISRVSGKATVRREPRSLPWPS